MERTRRRGKPSDLNKNKNESVLYFDSKEKLRKVTSYKRYVVFLLLLIVICLYFLYAPLSKFPKEVQYWHDGGFLFQFHEFNVHFQDIPRITQPVSLTPVLLVIHGFPTSSYDWKDLILRFHEKFGRVIIPDLLGFGFSDKPSDHKYSLKEQATMIEELMNYLKITDVHILAHDYGDSVVQELLARSSESMLSINIKTVCLTNGGIIPSRHNPRSIQKLLMLPVVKNIAPYLGNQFAFNSGLSAVFGPNSQPSSKRLKEFWSIVLYKKGYLVLPSLLEYISERHTNEERWVSALQNTSVPLHLIYGPHDPVNTREGFLKSYQSLIPHSSVTVLENVGHYPQIEDEAGFIKSYHAFLIMNVVYK